MELTPLINHNPTHTPRQHLASVTQVVPHIPDLSLQHDTLHITSDLAHRLINALTTAPINTTDQLPIAISPDVRYHTTLAQDPMTLVVHSLHHTITHQVLGYTRQ